LRVGSDLAEIDAGAKEFAGIEDVVRAAAGITTGDVTRAGIDDQARSIGNRHIAQPGRRGRVGLWNIECDLELVPG